MKYKVIPFRPKTGVTIHDTQEEAFVQAQKVANKTGDWACVQAVEGGGPTYVQPNVPAPRK